MKLTALVKKNLLLLFRRRGSSLAILFGPLLLVLFMSLAFHTAQPYSIIVGAYSERMSPLSIELLNALQEKQMSVVFSDSRDGCTEGVRDGIFTVCAIFPPDLIVEEGGTVTFYVDHSKYNFVYFVIESLTSEINKKSQELGEELTSDLLGTLTTTSASLDDKLTLLTTLHDSNRDAADMAESLRSSLQTVNLTFSLDNIPFSSLQAEVNELKSGSNQTTAADKYIADVQDHVKELVQEASYAEGIYDRVARDLGALNILLDQNTEYLNTLEANIEDVTRNIRGLSQHTAGKLISPLDTEVESIVQEKTSFPYLFPTLIALIVMFVGLFLASSLETRERMERTAFKNSITPTSPLLFVFATFVTVFIILALQLLILMISALLFMSASLVGNLMELLVGLFLIVSVFILLGQLIGLVFSSRESVLVGALSLGFIFLFFSSTILPVEAFPAVVKSLVPYTPFYASHVVLSKILLFQQHWMDLLKPLLVLTGWCVGLGLLVGIRSLFARGDVRG
jgi:ABC-type multidrug transport system permease subunit